VLVTVDNVGVPASIRDEVLRRLSTKTKVQDERFAICSSTRIVLPCCWASCRICSAWTFPRSTWLAIERYTRELTDKLSRWRWRRWRTEAFSTRLGSG